MLERILKLIAKHASYHVLVTSGDSRRISNFNDWTTRKDQKDKTMSINIGTAYTKCKNLMEKIMNSDIQVASLCSAASVVSVLKLHEEQQR